MAFEQTQAGSNAGLTPSPYAGWGIPAPRFQMALAEASRLEAASAFYKPQSEMLDPTGQQIVNTILNAVHVTTPRNYDYDYADIPASYYNVNSQLTPRDRQVASELGQIVRMGGAMHRSNGIQSYVQPKVLEESAIRDEMTVAELRGIVSGEEGLHEGIMAHNALQTDERKKIPAWLNEILGECVKMLRNPSYGTYYAFVTAMNEDLLRKYALAQQANPLLPKPPGSSQIPSDYNGITLLARRAMAKIMQQLRLSDRSTNSLDQQFIDAMQRSAQTDKDGTLRRQFRTFIWRLAEVARKTPQQVEQIFIAHYSDELATVVRDASRMTL